MLIRITADPLDPQPLVEHVRRDESGAVVLFLGVVRNNNLGRRVLHLEYDAYPQMAEKKLREVAEEVMSRWPITDIAIAHRTGRLEIGETSVVVAVSSPHRQEAFEACQQVVNRIKAVVPIWKKEVREGGESWIEGEEGLGRTDERRAKMARPPFEEVWRRIVAHAGETFQTKTGLGFTYSIDRDAFCPSRTRYRISRADFETAYGKVPMDGPGAINTIVRGPSYIWAVLHDPTISGGEW